MRKGNATNNSYLLSAIVICEIYHLFMTMHSVNGLLGMPVFILRLGLRKKEVDF